MKDKAAVARMLDYLRDMDPKMWEQGNGILLSDHSGEISPRANPACAGAHAAYGLGLRPVEGNERQGWLWRQGREGLARALGVDEQTLRETMSQNGASLHPFSHPVWDQPIYDVFRDTVKDLAGYDHDAQDDPEIHDFPLDPDEETINTDLVPV